MAFRVGWCLTANEAAIAYSAPARFVPPKDNSQSGRGFLSCPAVRGYFDGVFAVLSPFSLQIRLVREASGAYIKPVYPFSSLSEEMFRQFVSVEPVDSWLTAKTIALQLPSPYLFFADSPVSMEQFHPALTSVSSMNWRVIPGKFDIYAWQRPLNWAIEWDSTLGDLIIRAGEPQYFVRFRESSRGSHEADLVECDFTPKLKARLSLSQGITGIRKSTVPLMKKAGSLRAGKSLMKKKT